MKLRKVIPLVKTSQEETENERGKWFAIHSLKSKKSCNGRKVAKNTPSFEEGRHQDRRPIESEKA